MKLLIVTPEIHRLGGVANHYLGLSSHWSSEIEYLFYGKRNNNTPSWLVLLLYPYDFIKYLWKLLFGKIDVVILNPSLRKKQIIRDSIFLISAKLFRRPVVSFIHGFGWDYAKQLESNGKIFCWCFNKSMFIYTLYSEFEKELRKIGIVCPILLTTTKVSNEMLEGNRVIPKKHIVNILFVARILKEKGIFITLKAFASLKKSHPNLRLTVCGDGPELAKAKLFVQSNEVDDVIFRGNVTGQALANEYLMADLYLLPTYQEGMATTVLEAMAFGLPIISRPVGGVVDFWKSGVMGYLVESFEPDDYVKIIDCLIADPENVQKISEFNIKFAQEHFLADKVTHRFENDIMRALNK